MTALATIETLSDYLGRFGRLLAEQVLDVFDPLHVRGRDPEPAGLGTLLRPLYPAQADAASACVRVLERQRGALLLAEVGTGKTVMGLAAVHALAAGKPYRALILCPDHLIGKWARHVRAFVPGSAVRGWDGTRAWDSLDWVRLADDPPGEPAGPEWYILGRDASKFDPGWEPAAVERKRIHFGDRKERWFRKDEADPEPGPDVKLTLISSGDEGYRRWSIRKVRRTRAWACPRCGAVVTAGKGQTPVDYDWLARAKRRCTAGAIEPPGGWPEGTDPGVCGEPLWQFVGRRKLRGKAPLPVRGAAGRELADWSAAAWARWTDRRARAGKPAKKATPWRWAPARTIQARLPRGFFLAFVLDEAHEEKSEESAQSLAAGKLIAAAGRTLAMTGTLMGGYAWHLFPLLFRLAPAALRDDGFEWGELDKFTARYGRQEDRIEYPGRPKETVASHSQSMGRTGRDRSVKTRPGVVPTVFGDHLMERTVFLRLEQISDALPPRPIEEVLAVPMDPDQRDHYTRLESAIRSVIAPMIRAGDISLLGRMLHGLLGWPDHPFGWGDYFRPFDVPEAPELDPNRVYPKERALVDLCRAEAAAGRQVWVYCQMTDRRDVRPRLARLLADAGLTADTLDASVDRRAREAWIRDRGPRVNVAISHPVLVQTGLELFDPEPGGSNFSTIVFYQAGYNLFTLLQAGGRAWRIGQPRDCRTVYLYHAETMQARAIDLMGAKMAAAQALAGHFSAEGLAALSDDGTMELALARALVEHVRAARPAWPAARTPAPMALPRPTEPVLAIPGPGREILPPAPADAVAQAVGRRGGRRRADAPGQLSLFEF